ncbi:hypothetical protein RHGRI_009984 [Rhododendron griersonianum]|uniref:Uncharacterized protein n=1 Tax=Rhododendron griersonianum TaxID=479676 RepID=A0AAV6KHL3_9ERIC|nr:hypothetical protein RHGRI_009984 [Rhododendron griersonianum]
MSSESSSGTSPRPVGRRESPWGMSEGDHKQPTPHRCNDRVEDVIQVSFPQSASKPLIFCIHIPNLQSQIYSFYLDLHAFS